MPDVRLIDANAADVERICCYYGGNCDIEAVKEWLDEQPTIDAVPVVHGRWNPAPYTERHAKCSNCEVSRDIYTQIAWNYCPPPLWSENGRRCC